FFESRFSKNSMRPRVTFSSVTGLVSEAITGPMVANPDRSDLATTGLVGPAETAALGAAGAGTSPSARSRLAFASSKPASSQAPSAPARAAIPSAPHQQVSEKRGNSGRSIGLSSAPAGSCRQLQAAMYSGERRWQPTSRLEHS